MSVLREFYNYPFILKYAIPPGYYLGVEDIEKMKKDFTGPRSLSDFVQCNAKNRAKARFLPLKLRKEPRLSENFAVIYRKIPQVRQAPRSLSDLLVFTENICRLLVAKPSILGLLTEFAK